VGEDEFIQEKTAESRHISVEKRLPEMSSWRPLVY